MYNIACVGCSKVYPYVSETSQLLKKKEHRRGVNNGSDDTALPLHSLDTRHNFNFDHTNIIGRENDNKKRKIFHKTSKTVNFKTDSRLCISSRPPYLFIYLGIHYVSVSPEDVALATKRRRQ